MENNNFFNQSYTSSEDTLVASRAFISQVFTYMSAALAITGVVAYLFGTSADLLGLLINFETGSKTALGWIVMFAPLGFVLLMGTMVEKLSTSAMLLAFIAFSVIMGMSMSYIFLIYTQGSIYTTFFVTSATFGVMAFVGYTTKTDLTKFGSILTMALFGIIIASLANMFMRSEGMQYIISIVGVLVFTGLTAYDTQKLKEIGAQVGTGSATATKMAIMGALSLYLDFINLFLMLLRLFGGRNNN